MPARMEGKLTQHRIRLTNVQPKPGHRVGGVPVGCSRSPLHQENGACVAAAVGVRDALAFTPPCGLEFRLPVMAYPSPKRRSTTQHPCMLAGSRCRHRYGRHLQGGRPRLAGGRRRGRCTRRGRGRWRSRSTRLGRGNSGGWASPATTPVTATTRWKTSPTERSSVAESTATRGGREGPWLKHNAHPPARETASKHRRLVRNASPRNIGISTTLYQVGKIFR